ncbi:MAG: DNA topoisomerase IV subunit B [Gammaproteobacteria bacterium]
MKTKKNNNNYNSKSIEVLTGLEPVKKRPGMYTDLSRPNHLAQEVIDNSVDEAIAGFADQIKVIIEKDNAVTVIDNGRGMPVDLHPEYKIPGVELILTTLHSGAKFSNQEYKFSGGLHGVGVSVVNALSKNLEVTVVREGFCYYMEFSHGEKITSLKKSKLNAKQDINFGFEFTQGTMIKFWAEPKYFETPKINIEKLKHLLQAKAVLCPGLQVEFIDQHTNEQHKWQYQNGLVEYLLENIEQTAEGFIPEQPFCGAMKATREEVSWGIVWINNCKNNFQESYVNLVPTVQGGTHVNGFRTGLLEALREFCEIQTLLPKGLKLTTEDLWECANFVLSVKLMETQFSGQTKEKLSSRECATFVSLVLKDNFSLWLNQNVIQAKQIANLIIESAKKRSLQSKQITRKKVLSVGTALPGKLIDCSCQDFKQTELFLVEGDSAGGSAKQARNKEYQAVMPLRGKILNTWEVLASQILSSQEIHDISIAIGVDPNSDSLENLRYGKICILADADSDGHHIATLLCALFVRHFRKLVTAGHIFVAMPPLFRIDCGKQIYYALDEAERSAILDRINSKEKSAKINIQRFKGLGEMNPMQLRETTMDPDTRRLVQLNIDSDQEVNNMLDMLLAKKRSPDRREWLEQKGNLAEI